MITRNLFPLVFLLSRSHYEINSDEQTDDFATFFTDQVTTISSINMQIQFDHRERSPAESNDWVSKAKRLLKYQTIWPFYMAKLVQVVKCGATHQKLLIWYLWINNPIKKKSFTLKKIYLKPLKNNRWAVCIECVFVFKNVRYHTVVWNKTAEPQWC